MSGGQTVVVTGAAGGIGQALAHCFAADGARLALADIHVEPLRALAAELPGDPYVAACDLRDPAALPAFLATVERHLGPVDVFVANAGVASGTDPVTTDPDVWELAFDVNVRQHVAAARALLPGWLARGDGCFVSVASAAGLLTQLGSAPYAVSKHAAVAFAEWLSITYGGRGVQVACVCPMGVATDMLDPGRPGALEELGARTVKGAGAVLAPEAVADAVFAGLEDGRFLIAPHPEVLTYFQRRGADHERWITGMRRLQDQLAGA